MHDRQTEQQQGFFTKYEITNNLDGSQINTKMKNMWKMKCQECYAVDAGWLSAQITADKSTFSCFYGGGLECFPLWRKEPRCSCRGAGGLPAFCKCQNWTELFNVNKRCGLIWAQDTDIPEFRLGRRDAISHWGPLVPGPTAPPQEHSYDAWFSDHLNIF